MALVNFADDLMEAKRRARLSGRPLTRKETAGIVAGAADTASAREYRGQELVQRGQQFDERMAQKRLETNAQLDAASDARKYDQRMALTTGAAAAGIAGMSTMTDAGAEFWGMDKPLDTLPGIGFSLAVGALQFGQYGAF